MSTVNQDTCAPLTRNSLGRLGASNPRDQIPAIAGHVEEDGDTPVRFVPRALHEHYARRPQPLIRGLEVVHAQEEPHPIRALMPDHRDLRGSLGAGEQETRGPADRAHDHPPLGPSVVRLRGHVFDQGEVQHVDEERDRRIVVGDDERHEVQVGHGRFHGDAARGRVSGTSAKSTPPDRAIAILATAQLKCDRGGAPDAKSDR